MITFGPYVQGDDLPDVALEWRDGNGALLQFASGHTFELKLGVPGSAATLTKSTGFTGANVSPNLTIAWATSGELNTLAAGSYTADIIATRTSDSKRRTLRATLTVYPAIT